MGQISSALGLNYGTADSNSTSSQTSSGTGTTAGSTTPTYSGAQGGLQGALAQTLQQLLAQGGNSPQLQAQETNSANQINQNYSSLGTTMNRFLASRGFGNSGAVGTSALQTQIARQNSLAGNTAAYGATALSDLSTSLSQALQFAFANPGSSTAGTAAGSTTTGTTQNATGSSLGISESQAGSYGFGGGQ